LEDCSDCDHETNSLRHQTLDSSVPDEFPEGRYIPLHLLAKLRQLAAGLIA
jgi:hypothetical protein